MKKIRVEPNQQSPLAGGYVTRHNVLWTDEEGSGHPHVAIEGMTIDELLGMQLAIGQYLNRWILHRLEDAEQEQQ